MVISQSDIDELLNSALEESVGDGVTARSDRVPDDKVYRSPRIEAKRILFPYKSPIVKNNNIVYNPQEENNKNLYKNKVIVRSLDNYVEYIKKNQAV